MDADQARQAAREDDDQDGGGALPTPADYAEWIAIIRNACHIIQWCCKEYEDDIALVTQSNAGLLDDLVFLHESLHTPGLYGVCDEISTVLSAQIEHLSAALRDILPTLTALEGQLTRMIPPQKSATRSPEPSR
jgi:hypothetical protein